ncbi:MAG: hypothetical protein K6A65_04095 [Succinivibrionaceae bacterium]|nr:hypothetical protein [Succinivibrionaceae bacterium]
MGLNFMRVACLFLAALALPLAASAEPDGERLVRLGVVGEHQEQWELVAQRLAVDGITLEIVRFSDYREPNRALVAHEIDLNAFQHRAFLERDCIENGYEIEALAPTIISPMGLYSSKVRDLSELQDSAVIAIPNDPTNEARALRLLEEAGLIMLSSGASSTPTVADVTGNPLRLDFREMDASQTAAMLDRVAVAAVNGNYAVEHGLDPARDAISLDGVGNAGDWMYNPYVNVIAVRRSDLGNPLYDAVVKAYQIPEVAEIITRVSRGAEIPVFEH